MHTSLLNIGAVQSVFLATQSSSASLASRHSRPHTPLAELSDHHPTPLIPPVNAHAFPTPTAPLAVARPAPTASLRRPRRLASGTLLGASLLTTQPRIRR